MRYIPMFALAVAVTAAVSFTGSNVHAVAGDYTAVLLNQDTGTRHPYQPRTWGSAEQCNSAIEGITERLADISASNILTLPLDAPKADQDLLLSLSRLLASLAVQTGAVPRFSLSCEPPGDPA